VTPGATAPVLEIRKLVKKFGGLLALNQVDLQVGESTIAALIGPNGAGKTTLFNCLTGFFNRIEGGDILFMGRSILSLKSHAITGLGIARTFQNIRLFGNMTALENILVGHHCRMHGGLFGSILRTPRVLQEEKEAVRMAQELLRYVGLQGRGDTPARTMPYGDQRRVEIARALATEPKILLLDEPTAGMNPHESRELTHFLKSVRKEFRLSILLIEHDMRVVMNTSDQVTVLDFGMKIFEGAPEEAQKDPRVIQAYLGRTATRLTGNS
jgi:ABC-type branched-subunit amino acid transport system ATPase component